MLPLSPQLLGAQQLSRGFTSFRSCNRMKDGGFNERDFGTPFINNKLTERAAHLYRGEAKPHLTEFQFNQVQPLRSKSKNWLGDFFYTDGEVKGNKSKMLKQICLLLLTAGPVSCSRAAVPLCLSVWKDKEDKWDLSVEALVQQPFSYNYTTVYGCTNRNVNSSMCILQKEKMLSDYWSWFWKTSLQCSKIFIFIFKKDYISNVFLSKSFNLSYGFKIIKWIECIKIK